MAGEPKNLEKGIPGGTVVLDVKFYKYEGGPLTDDDRYITLSTLPVVEIYDPSDNLISRSTDPGARQPVRISIGNYEFTRDIGISDVLSERWKIIWYIRINGNDLYFTEYFGVVDPGTATFDDPDTRKGFAFNNPDYTAYNNWGAIIHPDELRWVYAFGNELIAPNAQTITDETLWWYINNAIGHVEKDLKINIFKKVIKSRDVGGKNRTDIGSIVEDVDFLYEDPYDFDAKMMTEYMFIKLKKRPVISIEKVMWRDIAGGLVLDLADWIRPNFVNGSIQFFPNTGSFASLPLTLGVSPNFFSVMTNRGRYPDAFYIDYTVGFKDVKSFRYRNIELFNVIGMLAAISLLNDYGDGKSPGLASSSVSLAGVSESFSTTQSATNALYGARIIQFSKQLSDFYKKNKDRYCGILLTAL